MKIISWNVNGLRAVLKKGFMDFFEAENADIFCVQETKMQPEQADFEFKGYEILWNSAVKKGYSGTAIISKKTPLSCANNFGMHTDEGRAICAEYDGFYLVNIYVPNSQNELKRIDYRVRWEDDFREYVSELDRKKPVIICGDMNVARNPIDLKNPERNEGSVGYSEPERTKLEQLLSAGFTDAFRHIYPDREGAYTWWNYKFKARASNAGWRIDYFLVSDRIAGKIEECELYSDIMGSDHCPIGLEIKI